MCNRCALSVQLLLRCLLLLFLASGRKRFCLRCSSAASSTGTLLVTADLDHGDDEKATTPPTTTTYLVVQEYFEVYSLHHHQQQRSTGILRSIQLCAYRGGEGWTPVTTACPEGRLE